MSDSKLLYNVPLQVVLPPLPEEKQGPPADCNINKVDMDKKLCKDLNLATATSDSNNSHHTAAVAESPTSEKKAGHNEETDGSISMTSSEKQEWSVTLYDVDRKGNVSEEDLARLVTMLYKAAGSSIRLPQQQQQQQQGNNGTKKIKLRLSVAPDNNHTKVYIQKPSSCPTTSSTNGTMGTPGSTACKLPTSTTVPPQQTSFHNRHVGSKRDRKQHRLRQHSTEGVNYGPTGQEVNSNRHSHRKKNKKRHSRSESADKTKHDHKAEEMCGPVQENMDRRQYYKDLVGIENETLQSLDYELDEKAHNRTAPPGLLSVTRGTQENPPSKDGPKSQTVCLPPEKGLGKGGNGDKRGKRYTSKQVHFEGGNHEGCGQHHYRSSGHHSHRNSSTSCYRQSGKPSKSRPKSCPAPGTGMVASHAGLKDYLFSKQDNVDNFEKEIEEGLDGLNVQLSSTPAKGMYFGNKHHHQPTAGIDYPNHTLNLDLSNNLEGISPHHMRRHRNREHEYNRSMKQVAEWIQRQHTWSSPATTANNSPSPQQQTQNSDGSSPPATDPVVLKHEHHHIHEHHHHYHFYHYYET